VGELGAFVALTLALAALWAGRLSASPRVARLWTFPFAAAVAAALAAGILDVRGVLAIFFFAIACRAANRARGRGLRIGAHALMLLIAAGLTLHVLPGFDNPRVLSGVVLSPDAAPYTKYLNFDKGVAGLFLLGIYAPDLPARDELWRHAPAWLWRCAALVAVMMAAATAAGYVHWDPKLPPWLAMWLWSMLFLTALPEEALFRGVVQTGLASRAGEWQALAAAAVLFGVAHLGGGLLYVLLSTVAGAGYGWIYLRTRSIAGSVLAHTALNSVHLLLFTYPALASRVAGA
jgi:membrane protease YdiL (CAAX protease family)